MAKGKLYKLEPEDMRHYGRAFFFEADGTMYYGKDEANLHFPDGYELTGKLAPLCLADLRAAFLLGMEAANTDF